MIFKGSRYEQVPVYPHYRENQRQRSYQIQLLSENSDLIPTLRRRGLQRFSSNEAFIHIYQLGDRIDLLAHKYYGEAQLWWVIMDANPKYMTPWDIKVGDTLYILPYNSIEEGEL